MKPLPKTPPKKESSGSEYETEEEVVSDEETELNVQDFVTEFIQEVCTKKNMTKIAEVIENTQFNQELRSNVEELQQSTDELYENWEEQNNWIESVEDKISSVSSCQNWTYLFMLVQIIITIYTYFLISIQH